MSYPDFVTKRVDEISEKFQVSREEVLREFEQIVADPLVAQDTQLTTPEERLTHASRILWTRYVGRPRVQEYDIVPLGYLAPRSTKSGDKMSSLFGLVKDGGESSLRRVAFFGEQAEKVSDITPFVRYKVKLGKFKDGKDMSADNRSVFENPSMLNLKPLEVFERLNVKKITISQAKDNPSLKDSSGYVDKTDWRLIRAIVSNKNSGQREDGGHYYSYTILDDTASTETVTQDGRVLRPGFTVWVDEKQHNYQPDDECDFIGTVEVSKKGQITLNAVAILPVHVRGGVR